MVKKENKKESKEKAKSYTVEDLARKFNGGISKPRNKKQ